MFLKEKKIKAKLNRIIRIEKKSIYNSLTDTIKKNMEECYRGKKYMNEGISIQYEHKTYLIIILCPCRNSRI